MIQTCFVDLWPNVRRKDKGQEQKISTWIVLMHADKQKMKPIDFHSIYRLVLTIINIECVIMCSYQ